MKRIAIIIGALLVFASAAQAKPARYTDGYVHHRTFTLHTARRQITRYELERGLPPLTIPRCWWSSRWEADCSIILHAAIFVNQIGESTLKWTEHVAVYQPSLRPIAGKYAIWGTSLAPVAATVR